MTDTKTYADRFQAEFQAEIKKEIKKEIAKDAANDVYSAFLGMIFAMLLVTPLAFWRGYVSVKLWEWFITPLSPGNNFPAPSIYVAVGAMFVLHSALPRPREEGGKGVTYNTIVSAAWPLSLLTFGALWHWLQWGV